MGKDKHVNLKGTRPQGAKRSPTVHVQGDGFFGKYPSWRISQYDKDPLFSINNATTEEIEELKDRLTSFESMRWGEIIGKQYEANKSHLIPIEGTTFSSDATTRLEKMKLNQVDHLASLRISGRKRLWGFIEPSGVFHVVWWDPDHAVLPVKK